MKAIVQDRIAVIYIRFEAMVAVSGSGVDTNRTLGENESPYDNRKLANVLEVSASELLK